MAESTRSGGASDAESFPAGLDASIRATWEAGYRAAMRDRLEPNADDLAAEAWEAHGGSGTRWLR